MNYYPNGKGGYSVYDDNWNQIDHFPARPTPMRRIMAQYPMTRAAMPNAGRSGVSGSALAGIGRGIQRRFGQGGDDQLIAAKTGEFVVNDKAAQRFGYDNLEKINDLGKHPDERSTTYGPRSPNPTGADLNERIGSYDNPLRTGDIAVHPRNPWGIRPGPNSYFRGRPVRDVTADWVPTNTVDTYYGYQGGGAVQPWWMRRQFNEEFGGRRGGYGIQPQSYQDGGTVEPRPLVPRPGGRHNFGRDVGGLEFDISERGRGQVPSVYGGGRNPMGFSQTEMGQYGIPANPFARPWLDKMFPGRGSTGSYAQGGVVGDFDEYRIGGRVGGRRGGRGRGGMSNMMMAYEGPTVEIPTDRGGRGPRIDPGDLNFFPPSYEPRFPSWPNPPRVAPPAYTDDDTNPTNYGPNPTGVHDTGGDYRDLSGFPGVSGAGTPSQTELSMYGGPSATGDYFIPFWANQS